jgi:pyruvate,water dikinase
VTRVGGLASHMATIAREYGVPTLVGVERALELPAGKLVTVDATGTAIYEGAHDELVEARRPEYDRIDEGTIYDVLGRVLDLVSPLRLIHPDDDDFRVENCVTFHDITRFAHQRAIEEMFLKATGIEDKAGVSLALESDIPMTMHILYLDREPPRSGKRTRISETDLDSRPMSAFWQGVKTEGWPRGRPKPEDEARSGWFRTTITKDSRGEFAESSFAILGADYMIVSLRMGYHFSTVEAMTSADMSKNFIRMQFNHGGATLERRARRVRLITDILRAMEFECQAKGDFLEATLAYKDPETIALSLTRLGRLTMMVKQLDMALSNDRIAAWYTRDFMKKLGLLDGSEKTFWRNDSAREEM